MSRPEQGADYAVSVVIPTRNRPERLRTCLAALAVQAFGRDRFEVIVVDDGSRTSLEPVVAPFRDDIHVRLIEQTNAGPAHARNVGAAHAVAPLLAFTDDDCEPDPKWLLRLHEQFQATPDRALGGHTVNALEGNVYSEASQLLVDYLYEHHAATTAHEAGAPPFFTSNNLAVPSNLFRSIGGFSESFPLAAGEDREFCDRWQEYGYGLLRMPDAVVRHSHLLSLSRFWRQHFNYGQGAFDLRRARAGRGQAAIRIEPLAFYRQLVTYPVRRPGVSRRVPLVILLALSQVANVAGFGVAKLRRR